MSPSATGCSSLAPPGGSTLRVPFSQIRSVAEPEPYTVRVTLADGNAIELRGLGAMRTQLLAELRDGRAEFAAETAAAVGEAEIFGGTAGGDSAEIRVYDDALLIITAAATERISFSFVGAVQVRDYTVTVEVAGRAPVVLTRLGRRSGELADLLTTRLREASGRTAAFLASLLPGLDPMTLRAASGLLRDGVAVPVSALDGLHPELSSALLGIATLPERQEMVTELARRTDLAIGFKQITSVRRPAVGVTPWYDHAVTPHIGDHGAPGSRFGPGLGGMVGAGIMSGIGSGGFGGGYGGGGYGGGWGDYWAFRALGAGMNGQQDRPMAPRADVTRGLLTPATEDLSALTVSGEDPTVLAFALGRRCDDGLPSLVLYEVLNQPEPLTYAYQPGTGSGPDELAAVNRCLDDAGFQTDAVHAEGLTSTGAPDASPLARWLAAKVPHDDQWASRLSALLPTGRLGTAGGRGLGWPDHREQRMVHGRSGGQTVPQAVERRRGTPPTGCVPNVSRQVPQRQDAPPGTEGESRRPVDGQEVEEDRVTRLQGEPADVVRARVRVDVGQFGQAPLGEPARLLGQERARHQPRAAVRARQQFQAAALRHRVHRDPGADAVAVHVVVRLILVPGVR